MESGTKRVVERGGGCKEPEFAQRYRVSRSAARQALAGGSRLIPTAFSSA